MSHFYRNDYTFYYSAFLLSPAPLSLFRLLTFQENGAAAKLDSFMRQCLREFPHTHSSLLQQMVATLAKVSPVRTPCAHYTRTAFIKRGWGSFISWLLAQLFDCFMICKKQKAWWGSSNEAGSMSSEKISSSLSSTKRKEFVTDKSEWSHHFAS